MASADILLECAKTGNAEAFGELYELYAKELYKYALKYLGNHEDAEDAVLEATLKVFKSICNVRNAASFKAYYFKAVSNSARTILSRDRHNNADIDEKQDLPSADNTEQMAIDRCTLDSALAQLNEDEREIVLLSAVSGFNSKEISQITGFGRSAIRSKLSRSLAKLRRLMD